MVKLDLIEGGHWVRCFKPGCLYSCRETYEFSRHFREYHNEPRGRRGDDGYMDRLLVIPAAEGPINRARWNAEETAMAPTVSVTLVEYRAALEVDRRTTLASLLTAKQQAPNQRSSIATINPTTTTSLGFSMTPAIDPSSVMTTQTTNTPTMPETRQVNTEGVIDADMRSLTGPDEKTDGDSEAINVLKEYNFLVKIVVEYNDHEMISNLETAFKDAIPTRVRADMVDVIGPPALSLSIKAMDATDSGSQMTTWYFLYNEGVFSDVVYHLDGESSILASLKIEFSPHSGDHPQTRANVVRDLGYLRDMPAGYGTVRGLESGGAGLPADFEPDDLVDSMEQPS